LLHVDARWRGIDGIGRFATEVVGRLPFEWREIASSRHPWSAADYLLGQQLRLRPTDVIYSPGFNVRATRAVQLITIHDLIHLETAEESSLAKSLYYNYLVRPAVRAAGRVMTVSDVSRKLISAWLADDSVEVVNVGNGCSPAFTPQGAISSVSRDAFVYVGNSKPHKNLAVVLRALQNAPHFRLIAVVSDPEKVSKMVWDAGIQKRVRILHRVTDADLSAIYRGSLGLLMPSVREGFGLPAAEAIKCGVPVAHAACAATVAEIVGNCGVAVLDAADSDQWIDAMNTIAGLGSVNPSTEWVARYDWDLVAGRVAATIEEFTNG
jgi:glycosyltransferase involved in cell wall biosynthesis